MSCDWIKSAARSASVVVVCVAALAWSGILQATPLELEPSLSQTGEGLDFIARGTGLVGLGAGSATITIEDIGGPVEGAWLYWAGRLSQQPLDGQDSELIFDGTPIEGVVVGTEEQARDGILNVGYRADVTAQVEAAGLGFQDFTIEDGNFGSNLTVLNGATLFIVFRDLDDTTTYRILGYDGLDFAFAQSMTDFNRFTVPVAIMHGAEGGERSGKLLYAVGDANLRRQDRVEVSENAPFVDTLDASDGETWDSDNPTVVVPAGVGETVVEVISPKGAENPDSLLWILAALRLPVQGSFCGDGTLDRGEECDDGNDRADDGCSPDCTIEATDCPDDEDEDDGDDEDEDDGDDEDEDNGDDEDEDDGDDEDEDDGDDEDEDDGDDEDEDDGDDEDEDDGDDEDEDDGDDEDEDDGDDEDEDDGDDEDDEGDGNGNGHGRHESDRLGSEGALRTPRERSAELPLPIDLKPKL